MATSVRTSALKTQRAASSALLKFGRGTRVLSISSKTSSIANNVRDAEDKDVANKYADGLLSNEDYLSYLGSMLGRSDLSYADKVKVQNSMRDTQDKIQTESLEAEYDSQPPDSAEKANAAQKIAEYWKTKAESLVPGTPAYSTAVANYGNWNNKYNSAVLAAGRAERAVSRAQSELDISMMDASTSEKTVAKSNMYAELAQQALEDGDSAEATRLQTLSNNTYTQAQTQYQSENRTEGRIQLNNLKNMWHDGTISTEDLNVAVNELNNQAIMNSDDSLLLAINSFTDTVSKDIEKGLKRGEWGGLPVVKGRGGKAGMSSILNPKTNKTWEEEDDEYTQRMQSIDWDIKTGKINAEDGRGQQIILMMERQSLIKDRIDELGAMGVGSKVPYNGSKKDAESVRDDFVAEYMSDSSKPFTMKNLTPEFLKGAGLQQIMDNDFSKLVAAKYNDFVQSGVDVANLTPEQVFEQLDLDLQGKSGVAYIQKFDDNNQPYYDVVSTQNNPKFIPGVTHITDGYIWHEITSGSVGGFPTEEAAAQYFASIFNRAPDSKEIEEDENGFFKLNLPAHAVVGGEAWVRTEGGGWRPVGEQSGKDFDEVNSYNLPDNPITDENRSFTVLRPDTITYLKGTIQSAVRQNQVYGINEAERNDPLERERAVLGENLRNAGMAPTVGMVNERGQITDRNGRVLSQREVYNLNNPPLVNRGESIRNSPLNRPELIGSIKLPPVAGLGQTQSYKSPLGLETKPSNQFVQSIANEGWQAINNGPQKIDIPSGTQIFPTQTSLNPFQPSSAPRTSNLSPIDLTKKKPVDISTIQTSNPIKLPSVTGLNSNLYGNSNAFKPAVSVQQPVQQKSAPKNNNIFSSVGQWLQPTLSKITSWWKK